MIVDDIKRPAQLHGLDAETLRQIQGAWLVVEPQAKGILTDFFDSHANESAISPLDAERKDELIASQLAHWQALCEAPLEEQYSRTTREIIAAMSSAGLPSHAFLMQANHCLSRFVAILAARYRFRPSKSTHSIRALTTISMFDIAVSLSHQLDLQRQVELQRKHQMATAFADFENSVGPMAEAVLEASSTLGAIAALLENEAATAVEKIGYANEVSGLIVQRIEKGAEIVREVLTSMSDVGRQGVSTQSVAGETVERNRHTAQAITEAVGKMGQIIGMISKIAGQTNMLALNARIEACRAGDFGKGFAVIAQEVKTLAVQTSTATSEISTQIDAVERATEISIEDIELTCQTIGEIARVGHAITASVQEQGDAARRINRNISDAARFAQAVTESILAIEAVNTHTRHEAQSLSALAKSLGSCGDELQANASVLRRRILFDGF